MKKKSEFEAPYIGIETIDNTPIFYNRRGDYSAVSYTPLDVYKRQVLK